MASAARPWNEPMLIPAVGMAAGVLLSRVTAFEVAESLACAAVFAALAALPGWRARRLTALGLAALLCGTASSSFHKPGPKPVIDATAQETVVVEGCVVEPSVFSENREQFTLELAPQALARVTLNLREGQRPPRLQYGQRVEFEGRVRAPHNFGNPGAFDYETYLARRNVYWNISTRTGAPLTVLEGECGDAWHRGLYAVRTAALERLDALFAGDEYKTIMMQAVLLGETTRMEKSWTEDYRRTGTYHALVISGLHLTLLAGTLHTLFRRTTGRHGLALTLGFFVCWLFALAAGLMAPVARAAGGFTLFLAARFFHRPVHLLNATSMVVLVFLLADPSQLFDGSFQLSVLSVLAIGALAEPLLDIVTKPLMSGFFHLKVSADDLERPPFVSAFRVEAKLAATALSLLTGLPRKHMESGVASGVRFAIGLFEILLLSAVVQIALALPMALFFHRASLTGLLANVLIVPMMNAVVLLGFASVAFNARWIAAIAGWLLEAARAVAAFFAGLEPSWRIPDPPLWLALSFAAALVALALVARQSTALRRTAIAAVLALFALIVVHPFRPLREEARLEVTAIDVGQGDSLLLVSPAGRTVLIDAGGVPAFKGRPKPRLDVGEDVVSSYLWTRSIQSIDVLALTHAHEDHSGGLAALMANFRPKELWIGAMGESEVWRRVRQIANQYGVRIVARRGGETIPFDGAEIRVFAPFPDYQPAEVARNNDSLVLHVRYGRRSFLLTGDAEKEIEYRLVDEGLLPGPIDVLKLGHHGSRTSSTKELLDATRPAFAIASAGFENLYRHPHPDVLRRLNECNVRVLRTDTGGMVQFLTDGHRLEKRAYNRQLAAMQ